MVRHGVANATPRKQDANIFLLKEICVILLLFVEVVYLQDALLFPCTTITVLFQCVSGARGDRGDQALLLSFIWGKEGA